VNSVSAKKLKKPMVWFKQALDPHLVSRPQLLP